MKIKRGQAPATDTDIEEEARPAEIEIAGLPEDEISQAVGDEPAAADLDALGDMRMMAGDAVGPGIGKSAKSANDVGRRERDILEAGVTDGDDEVAAPLGLADLPRQPLHLPAADAGSPGRGRQVLALAEVDDSDALLSDAEA